LQPFELVRPRLSTGPKSAQACPPPMRRLASLDAVSCHRDPMAADGAQALDRNRSFGGRKQTLGRGVNARQSGAKVSPIFNAIAENYGGTC